MMTNHPLWNFLRRFMLLLAALYCIFPFIILAVYANPNAEDFSHSFLPKVSSVLYSVFDFFKNKEARIFTNLLYALNPLTFGFKEGYKLLPLILIFFFLTALNVLFKNIFSIKELSNFSGFTALFILSLFFAGMPSPVHALYWMSSSFNYSTSLILWLFLLSQILASIKKIKDFELVKVKSLFMGVILIFCIVLSNEIYIITLTLFFFMLFVFAFIRKNPMSYFFLTYLFVTLSVSSIYLLPHIIMSDLSPVVISFNSSIINAALLLSVKNTFFNLVSWVFLNPSLIILSLIFIFMSSIIYPYSSKLKAKFVFVNFWFYIPFVFIILASLLIPYYMFRNPEHQPQRIFNIQFMIFLVAWIYGLFNFILRNFKKIDSFALNKSALFKLIISLAFVVSIIATKNIKVAYSDIFSGKAAAYNNEMNKRFDVISNAQNSSHKTAVVEYIENRPQSLFFPPEIEPERAVPMWNEAYENYFSLKEIILLNHHKDSIINKR
ncbi:MAG: hypothetical protein PHT69_12515 [Bacteroidales bacterium]|nr:hypothetical protein [Bacteroidales bacterium]